MDLDLGSGYPVLAGGLGCEGEIDPPLMRPFVVFHIRSAADVLRVDWVDLDVECIFNNLRQKSKSTLPDRCKAEAVRRSRRRHVEKRV